MTSESAHQNLFSESVFRSTTSEASLQKHYFRSTLQLLITVLMVVQKGVHKQTQNHQEHEEHASTHDKNKRSSKVHLHGSINNKGMDKELCQKGL